eukprot:g9979.t1
MSAVNAREPAGWKCVSGCGACCMLGTEDGADTRKGWKEDGWCKHFDHESRTCKIYDDRPDFCRVKTFLCAQAPFFGVDSADEDALGGFCADSCRQNIGDVYGDDSEEMLKFDSEVSVFLDIENEDGEIPEMSPRVAIPADRESTGSSRSAPPMLLFGLEKHPPHGPPRVMPPVLFRKWAGAAPAKPKQNGSGAVPYGLDFEEGQEEALGSTVHRSFLGFSQESTKRTQEEPPAGVILKDGRTAALATTRSDWGSPDWKCLTSNYSSSCNEKALARYHRRKIKSKELCQQQREERWVKCFRRWEKRDATTVTSTEFSILPAGWHIDGRPLPVGIPPKPKAAAQILAEAQAAKAAKGASMPCAKECPALSVGAAGPVALRAETPEVDLALPTRAPTPSTPARSRLEAQPGGRALASHSWLHQAIGTLAGATHKVQLQEGWGASICRVRKLQYDLVPSLDDAADPRLGL